MIRDCRNSISSLVFRTKDEKNSFFQKIKGLKYLFLISILPLSISCSASVDKPTNLIEKDKMAEIIADFSIYDQAYTVDPKVNMENSSRYVLKKHNIKAKYFKDSYQYYLSNPSSLDGIYDKAQQIIINKDPKAKDFIEKKKKEINNAVKK